MKTMIIAGAAGLLLSGCATQGVRMTQAVSAHETEYVKSKYTGPKRRVGVVDFVNKTAYGKGRLGGAEMARVETQMMGSIPLQTLQAHVDYAQITAVTKVGAIGIKVWIFKGMYGDEITPTADHDRFRRRGRR